MRQRHTTVRRYRSPFGYILVDEFQDISPARARFLRALLVQAPTSQLFAVGDDWQAIFRFGGSDVAVMREFDSDFGASRRMDLETTFRCSERIAVLATDSVLRNPAQIRKTVRSMRRTDGPSVHVDLSSAETAASALAIAQGPGEEDRGSFSNSGNPGRSLQAAHCGFLVILKLKGDPDD